MKKGSVKGICPNCQNKNRNLDKIKRMKDGKCGVCAGKGYIIWTPIGRVV